jgi:hypothetical protein
VFFLSKLFHPALSYCDSTLDWYRTILISLSKRL